MATTLAKDNFAAAHISAMVPSYWSNLMQVPLRKSLVSEAVANTQFEATLRKGDTVHFPYLSETEASEYTRNTEITASEASATDESLVVDKAYVVPNYVEDFELLQANYSYQIDIADNAAYKLRDKIDQDVFARIIDAASGLYEASGITYGTQAAVTGGDAITATSANIAEIFATARKALRKQNVEEAGDWCSVITPDVAMAIELYGTEKGFSVADATIRNGYAGDFLGFQIYISNNLPDNYAYIGKKNMIHLIAQAPPQMQIKEIHNKLGRNMIASTLLGVKTFDRNSKRFLLAKITA